MPQYKHPFLALPEGASDEPRDDWGNAPSGPALPRTTVEKAALCDALLPFLTGLRETVHAVAVKQPGAAAGDEVVMMAQILLADVRSLLRGERMGRYVDRLAIAGAPHDRLGLAIKLQAMEIAVKAFRRRYFGYNSAVGGPAWLLAGETGAADARRLLPPDETPPPNRPATNEARMAELRNKIARRISQIVDQEKAATSHSAGL
jgi:hypothetical protein